MALFGLDAAGNSAYIRATGAGTTSTPYTMQHDLFTTGMKSAFVQSTSGETLIAASGTATYRVTDLVITATSGCTVKLQSSGTTATDLTPEFPIQSSGSLVVSNPLGLFQNAAGENLITAVSAGGEYQVMVTYREV